jgi:hypothetical protein
MGIIYGVHDRLLVMIGNKDAYDIELDAAVAELGGGVVLKIAGHSMVGHVPGFDSESSSSSQPVKCAPLELTSHCHPLPSVIHISRNALTITHAREKFPTRPVRVKSAVPGS